MRASQLKERLDTWLKLAEERSEIPAVEADWRRILLKSASQIDVSTELVGTPLEKDLLIAVELARLSKLESFEQVRELFQSILQEMRVKGIG